MRKLVFLLLLIPFILDGQTVISNSYKGPSAGAGPSFIDCLAYYKFNGDLTDEMGTYDGSAVGTLYYDGDTCLYFSGSTGNEYSNIGQLAFTGGDFSIAFRIYLYEGSVNENYYFMGNNTNPTTNNGISGYWDQVGSGVHNLNARTVDAAGSFTTDVISQSGSSAYRTWRSVVITVHNADNSNPTGNAYGRLYIDNSCVNCTGDSTFYEQAPFNYTGQDWAIGNLRSISQNQGLREGARIDEVMFFDQILSPAYVDSIYNHPYRLPYE